jgi:hypothetical protein
MRRPWPALGRSTTGRKEEEKKINLLKMSLVDVRYEVGEKTCLQSVEV